MTSLISKHLLRADWEFKLAKRMVLIFFHKLHCHSIFLSDYCDWLHWAYDQDQRAPGDCCWRRECGGSAHRESRAGSSASGCRPHEAQAPYWCRKWRAVVAQIYQVRAGQVSWADADTALCKHDGRRPWQAMCLFLFLFQVATHMFYINVAFITSIATFPMFHSNHILVCCIKHITYRI